MATINITDLCFSYDGGEELFSHVSLQIDTRWKLGLIGRNGRGKTTLLKLLLGEYPCDGKIDSPVPLAYFPYVIRDDSRTTIEIIEEQADFEPWQLERELSLLDVAEEVLSRPFETLSGGEQTKVLLAALFLNENRFLLLDEPTNHLDSEARKIVGDYLSKKSGFILASHDRRLLDRCVDHVLSINRSGIELVQGNFSTWQQNRDYREKFEAAENRRLCRDIRHLKDAAQQSSDWSRQAEKEKYGHGPVDRGFLGSKAAKMMKRAKTTEARRQKAAEEKSKLFQDMEVEENLSLSPLRFHTSRLLDLSGISVRYDHHTLFENFSLSIRAGDRIALRGRNGSGKSSVLKLIAGENIPYQGSRTIPASLKISYLPQDASFLRGGMREFLYRRQLDESRFKTILHKLGFSRNDFDHDMSGYSAGQKKKVLLAASICEQAHLYLWDEALNYIDVISRLQIENLLLEYCPTLVFVEHDLAFLEAVATRKIELA